MTGIPQKKGSRNLSIVTDVRKNLKMSDEGLMVGQTFKIKMISRTLPCTSISTWLKFSATSDGKFIFGAATPYPWLTYVDHAVLITLLNEQ